MMPAYDDQKIARQTWFALLAAVVIVLMLVAPLVIGPLSDRGLYLFGRQRRWHPNTSCLSNLKQIGTAINMYMQDNDDRFPLVSGFGPELDGHTDL